MSDVVIKVENLSKQYRLGTVGTGTLSHDLNRLWAKLRGKEDPYAKIGEVNDRTKKSSSEYVWALKDINFEVKRGEVLGIIGRNGAGKSTLLKILSQITRPTTGSVKMNGRVGSLLEVGTGFHPDLTGRENIFINGAILGMRKWEIDKRLEEIIDFAGVEKYIDTPVKRYSSGMMVRLGFSVAAHLEPEILIVDEVLAVGDAEFQKKCIGKMGEVSREDDRTILFVSHSISAIKNICNKGIILNNGRLEKCGDIDHVVDTYLNAVKAKAEVCFENYQSNWLDKSSTFKKLILFNPQTSFLTSSFKMGEDIGLELVFKLFNKIPDFNVSVRLSDPTGLDIAAWRTREFDYDLSGDPGEYALRLNISGLNIFEGKYYFSIALLSGSTTLNYLSEAIMFEITPEVVATYKKVITKKKNIIYSPATWGLVKKNV